MRLPEAGEFLLLLLGLVPVGLAGLASALLLAHRGRLAPRILSCGRLHGADLLAAAVLYLGGGRALAFLFGGSVPAGLDAPLAHAASGLLAWLFLRLRAGSLAPRDWDEEAVRPADAKWALGTWARGLPLLAALLWWNRLLVEALTGEPPPVEALPGLPGAGAAWGAAAVLGVLVLAPLVEEVLFRGYLFRWLAISPRFGLRRALLLSSLAFALLHDPRFWLPMAWLGLLLGWTFWRSGQLRHAILVHALHNALALASGLLLGASSTTP